MKYFMKELYNIFCLMCVGFTCAYFLALYYGVNTNLSWGV